MPYSFTQIERSQTRIIQVVFWFLIVWYFAFLWLCLWFIVVNFYDMSWPSWKQTGYVFEAALAVGFIHWFFSTRNGIYKALKILKAVPPSIHDDYHRRLQNIVEEVSVATGGHKFEVVISPSFSLNSFSLQDFSGRSVIGVTEGLLARLTRAQLEAIVAHQAAYIVSGDCLATTVTSSLSEVYTASFVNELNLRDLRDGYGGLDVEEWPRYRRYDYSSIGSLGLFPLLAVSWFMSQFLRMFLSRRRHKRADATAVRLSRDPLSLAEAIYIMSFHWRGSGLPDEQLEAIFILDPSYSPWEGERIFSAFLDTHPPIRQRLEILLRMAHADMNFLAKSSEQTLIMEKKVAQVSGLKEASFHRKASSAGCPRCGNPLNSQEYEGMEILQCQECQGVLVHESSIQKIIVRRDIVFSESIHRAAEVLLKQEKSGRAKFNIKQDSRTMLFCPVCRNDQVKMFRQFYTYTCLVEVDHCFICQHYWFDKEELEILQCLIEQRTKISSENDK